MKPDDLLAWLNLIQLPVLWMVVGIKADVAALRATVDAHDRRLTRLEGAEA